MFIRANPWLTFIVPTLLNLVANDIIRFVWAALTTMSIKTDVELLHQLVKLLRSVEISDGRVLIHFAGSGFRHL